MTFFIGQVPTFAGTSRHVLLLGEYLQSVHGLG